MEKPFEPQVAPSPDRPTPLPVHSDGISLEFKGRDSWVLWNYEFRGGHWTKPPYRADEPGRKADSTDPDTWCSYRTALASYEDGKADGVGFVPEEGLVGIDLDHCRDPQTGDINPGAMKIVNQANSHTEITVSGEGLRIFLRAQMTTKRRRAAGVEIYPGGGGRYFTTTGLHLTGTPTTIESRQDELEFICSEHLADPTATSTTSVSRSTSMISINDAELIIRARDAKNGDAFSRLWEGDISGHASHSEADLALVSHLAFWTGQDTTRIDSLFRQSGLMRDKWDERHGELTYGERTVTRATSTSVSTSVASQHNQDIEVSSQPAPAHELRVLDDVEIMNQPPPTFQIDSITVEKSLVVWYGPSGVGKTFALAAYGCALATGTDFFGHEVPRPGPFVHVLAEGASGFGLRLQAWKHASGVPAKTCIGYYTVQGAVNLLDNDAVSWLIDTIAPLGPSAVAFDTLQRCMVGGEENSVQDMGRVVDAADRVRRSTGATVLLAHHPRKDHRFERGSGALRGAVDTMLSMTISDDTIQLSCTKQKDSAEFAPISLKLVPTLSSCVLRPAAQIIPTDALSGKQAELLAALRSGATAGGLTGPEWKTLVPEVVDRTYYKARTRLVELGYVAEHGKYFSWTGKEPPRGER